MFRLSQNQYSNETPDIRLESIYQSTRDIYFSKNTSISIVGSRSKLEELVARGFIRADKQIAKKDGIMRQNGRWQCYAPDVLRFAKSIYE